MSAAKLRSQDHYKSVTRELRAAGLSWREEFGGKHARLVIAVNGREEVEIMSISPSDRRVTKQATAHIRRRIRQWQAEATSLGAVDIAPAVFPTLEERTMDDSTAPMAQGNFLRLFFEGSEVRVRDDHGEPWFVLADVCRALGLTNPSVAAQALDEDEKAKLNLGRGIDATIISESGLYTIVLRSRAATTPGTVEHRFRRWVTSEVLPSFRRNGIALPPEWDRLIGMTKMLSRKVTELERANADIMRFITDPAGGLVPAHDLAGTVTASTVIDMAGVDRAERVRGTSAIVTRCLKDFSLQRGFRAYQTPEHIDPSKRWRFMQEAATAWLTGEQGIEIIRSHIARQRAKTGRGQMALQLVEGGRP